MKKKLLTLAASALMAIGVLAGAASPANATIITSGVPCSWSTSGGRGYSPYYGIYYYYLGHDIIGGHWYRAFYVTNLWNWQDHWDQYCG